MSGEGFDTAKVMRIINHPVRMRIIELLATRGPMTWKELSSELGIRTGALYHHLDTLEKIVTRDSERRYAVTKLGQEIYEQLNQNPSQSALNIEKAIKKRTPLGVLRGVFAPRELILAMSSSKVRAVASLAFVSAFVLLILSITGNQLLLLSFSIAGDPVFSIGTYFISLLVITAISNFSLAVAFRQRGDTLTLLATSALAFIPISAFGLVVHYLATASSLPSLFSDRTALTIMFAFFQAWGAGIVGAGMSVSSGLRIEKTLVVSLGIIYASMFIIVLQGGRIG